MPAEFPFKRYHVPIIVRALRVLEFLAEQPKGAGTTEISEHLKIPKNTAFRILTTLADYGYLARDDEGKTYRLERKLLNLGYAAIDESSLAEKALDVMRELRNAVGESVFLAVRLERQGVVVEQVPGLRPIKVLLQLGHRFPMHTSAPGKALLAWLPEVELNEALGGLKYPKFTEQTITSVAAMRRELAEVRRLGYALDRAEEVGGMHCVGAPIFDHNGRPLAAIWFGGMAAALPEADFTRLGTLVREGALKISRRFGYEAKV